jgi:hypothetical protein
MFKASDLAHFSGSEGYFFNPLFKGIDYTDGVKFLGANGANWLVVKALALIGGMNLMAKHDNFLAIKCVVVGTTANFLIEDGDEKIIYTEIIHITDLPCNVTMFCCMGEKPVLMLSSEY